MLKNRRVEQDAQRPDHVAKSVQGLINRQGTLNPAFITINKEGSNFQVEPIK